MTNCHECIDAKNLNEATCCWNVCNALIQNALRGLYPSLSPSTSLCLSLSSQRLALALLFCDCMYLEDTKRSTLRALADTWASTFIVNFLGSSFRSLNCLCLSDCCCCWCCCCSVLFVFGNEQQCECEELKTNMPCQNSSSEWLSPHNSSPNNASLIWLLL